MAKRHAYAYLKVLSQQGVDCIYGLFTNLYGKHDTYNEVTAHVIPSLIYKALRASDQNPKSLNVWGNGEASRDFLYVKDAARAVIHLLIFSEKEFETYNIASGIELKISDIAELLKEMLNLENVYYDASQPVGIRHRSVDVDKLKQSGFSCKYTLKQGLKEVLDFMRYSDQMNKGNNRDSTSE